MKPAAWAARAYEFFDALTWIALLNLAFISFTVLGGILFGFCPALVAASSLVRRRTKGEVFNLFRAFGTAWKLDFFRSNKILLPIAFALAALVSSWEFFRTDDYPAATVLAAVTLVVIAICVGVVSVLVPMVNHYDIQLRAVVPTAVTFTLVNPLLLILNLLVLAGVVFATRSLPGLLPFFTFGTAIYLTTRIALDFFHRNESRLAASASEPASTAELSNTRQAPSN